MKKSLLNWGGGAGCSGQLFVTRLRNKPKSSLTTDHRQLTTAFTLVELLVVIAIIGVLIALLLPAVQETIVTKQTQDQRTETATVLRLTTFPLVFG